MIPSSNITTDKMRDIDGNASNMALNCSWCPWLVVEELVVASEGSEDPRSSGADLSSPLGDPEAELQGLFNQQVSYTELILS